MVPNHTGIFSKWMVEKPDYFLGSDRPPYPSYTFNGPDLSEDSRVEVRIEDKYYSKTDAAVVFQRRDSYTGDVKYIYHGNDGTNMPWNDTAQLNLLNPEVRESLIQTIMHVARKTSIIRFDAAMTLTKKHYQRLWFPQAGSAGAVPSRSDYSMSRAQFDALMPDEFWREVVDRINKELPNTLLLAEAFWLMEGYFVRTLGMHRVYNSAFMHMLMKEENDKYKQLIKNTLEFNPEILKRYVNFMSNPDEETAVNQFGKGDKYFGVVVVMVTMPGLPMFAHGQIEGFSEKYGMEYKRSYYNESIDENLVRRHESEIFPLTNKRYLFSQVDNFELYDFIDDFGNIVDSVFAYSNMVNGERSFVIFNNSYTECRGSINYATGKILNGNLQTKKLSEALSINSSSNFFYIIKENKTNLEFLYSGKSINNEGLFFNLIAYEYKAFINFKEVFDDSGKYWELLHQLNGRGVSSVENAVKELSLTPFLNTVKYILNNGSAAEFSRTYFLSSSIDEKENEDRHKVFLNEFTSKFENVKNNLKQLSFFEEEKDFGADQFSNELDAIFNLSEKWKNELGKKIKLKWFESAEDVSVEFDFQKRNLNNDLLFAYLIIDKIILLAKNSKTASEIIDQLLLKKVLYDFIASTNYEQNNINNKINLIFVLMDEEIKNIYQSDFGLMKNGKKEIISNFKTIKTDKENINARFIQKIFNNKAAKSFLNVNTFEGVAYFNKENFDELLRWIYYLTNLNLIKDNSKLVKPDSKKNKIKTKKINKATSTKIVKTEKDFINEKLKTTAAEALKIKEAAAKSQYKVDELIGLLNQKKNRAVKTKPVNKKVKSAKKPNSKL